MAGSGDNPFDRYDLDPREGLEAITRRLKELAEDARSDEERERVRASWEELTLNPARRLRAAFFAHPESRSAIGRPPPRARKTAEPAAEPLSLRAIAPRPSVVRALEPDPRPTRDDDDDGLALDDLEDDPVLSRASLDARGQARPTPSR